MKKVSVIIPTYRRNQYLCRAINSVLAQDYKNIEIIVVDDNGIGTTEQIDTYKRIEKYLNYEDFIYIPHEKNRNGSAARNTGINKASGDYIALLDDDDEFLPHKIRLQVEMLERLDNQWGAVYSSFIRIYPSDFKVTYLAEKTGDILFDLLSMNVDTDAGSTLLFRREVLDQVNEFDETFQRHQDIEFIVRIAKHYKIGAVQVPSTIKYEYELNKPRTARDKEKHRQHFLQKFKAEIRSFPCNRYKQINFIHRIDIAKQYLKDNDVTGCIRNLFRSGNIIKGSYIIFKDAVKHLGIRKKTGRCS